MRYWGMALISLVTIIALLIIESGTPFWTVVKVIWELIWWVIKWMSILWAIYAGVSYLGPIGIAILVGALIIAAAIRKESNA